MVVIDQSPIGRTPRSNPATYTGTFDLIRELFSMTPEAKLRGYTPGRFSFNVKGGRCEACQGDGIIKIEMHFLPDVYVPCEVCKGKRYNAQTLEVKYKGKSISDVLEMRVDEAVGALRGDPAHREQAQDDLPRSASATSRWASRRRSSRAARRSASSSRPSSRSARPAARSTCSTSRRPVCTSPTSTSCSTCCSGWCTVGNTVLVIEHNLDVIKTADYLIDLGPEGGDRGGTIVGTGTPEEVAANPRLVHRPVPQGGARRRARARHPRRRGGDRRARAHGATNMHGRSTISSQRRAGSPSKLSQAAVE